MSRPGVVRTREGALARKRFGQHYLTDRAVVQAIVKAIEPSAQDRLLEIGPGTGALTGPLIEALGAGATLDVVEIDRDLADRLESRWGTRIRLHRGDALGFDFGAFGNSLRVVGNLPYNISSPLLMHLVKWASQVRDQHFMLQREVVERIVATPGPQMGRLSVALQNVYEVVELFDVQPESFDPPPKVESAVIRMVPRARPLTAHTSILAPLLAAAFSQRRKMLRNTLSPWLAQHHPGFDLAACAANEEGLASLGDPTLRAEQVPVRAWCRLADLLSAT